MKRSIPNEAPVKFSIPLWILLIMAMVFVLTGCNTTHPRVDVPSVAAVGRAVSDSKALATGIYEKGAAPRSAEAKAVVQRLQDAEVHIEELYKKIESQSSEYEKVLERLNYIEPKYAKSVGILWKWRLICFGLILWILRKPIISAIGFIGRKFAGVPWIVTLGTWIQGFT